MDLNPIPGTVGVRWDLAHPVHLPACLFGQWEEAGEYGGNPHEHEENMETPRQTGNLSYE